MLRLRVPPISGPVYDGVYVPNRGDRFWREENMSLRNALFTPPKNYDFTRTRVPLEQIYNKVTVESEERLPMTSSTHVSAPLITTVLFSRKRRYISNVEFFWSRWVQKHYCFFKDSDEHPDLTFAPVKMNLQHYTQRGKSLRPIRGIDYLHMIWTAVFNIYDRLPDDGTVHGKISEKTWKYSAANMLTEPREKDPAGKFSVPVDLMFVMQDVHNWTWLRTHNDFNHYAQRSGSAACRHVPTAFDLGGTANAQATIFGFDWNLFCDFVGCKPPVMYDAVIEELDLLGSLAVEMRLAVFCLAIENPKRFTEGTRFITSHSLVEARFRDMVAERESMLKFVKAAVMPVWFLPVALRCAVRVGSINFSVAQCLMSVTNQLLHIALTTGTGSEVATRSVARLSAMQGYLNSEAPRIWVDSVLANNREILRARHERARLAKYVSMLETRLEDVEQEQAVLTPLFESSGGSIVWDEREVKKLLAYCINSRAQRQEDLEALETSNTLITEALRSLENMKAQNESLESRLQVVESQSRTYRCAIHAMCDAMDIETEKVLEVAAMTEGVNEKTKQLGIGWLFSAAKRRREIRAIPDSDSDSEMKEEE